MGASLLVFLLVGIGQGAAIAAAHEDVPTGSVAGKVQLTLDKRIVAPGGIERMRVENGGTKAVSLDFAFSLARRSGGDWVRVPGQPVFSPRITVAPGTVGPWQRIRIRRSFVSGFYRVRKVVKIGDDGDKRDVQLQATFRVR